MNLASIPNPLAGSAIQPPPLAEQKNVARSVSNEVATPMSSPAPSELSRQVPKEFIEEAVKKVNEFVKPINNSLSFNLDEESGQTIIKVVDLATQEVIRQIPSEEMLAIAKALDTMKGLLVQQKA